MTELTDTFQANHSFDCFFEKAIRVTDEGLKQFIELTKKPDVFVQFINEDHDKARQFMLILIAAGPEAKAAAIEALSIPKIFLTLLEFDRGNFITDLFFNIHMAWESAGTARVLNNSTVIRAMIDQNKLEQACALIDRLDPQDRALITANDYIMWLLKGTEEFFVKKANKWLKEAGTEPEPA